MKFDIPTVVLAKNIYLREGVASVLASTRYRVILRAENYFALGTDTLKEPPGLIIVATDDRPADIIASVVAIRGAVNGARIVVLGAASDPETCGKVLQVGASSFLPMGMTTSAFINGLDLIVESGITIHPGAVPLAYSRAEGAAEIPRPGAGGLAGPRRRTEVIDADGARLLSSREREILDCIARGESNKHIGRRCAISEATVKVHVKSILRKINVCNRTQAAIWAMSNHAGK